MFSHMFLGVAGFERALGFYSPVLSGLRLEARFCDRSRPCARQTAENATVYVGKALSTLPSAVSSFTPRRMATETNSQS